MSKITTLSEMVDMAREASSGGWTNPIVDPGNGQVSLRLCISDRVRIDISTFGQIDIECALEHLANLQTAITRARELEIKLGIVVLQ